MADANDDLLKILKKPQRHNWIKLKTEYLTSDFPSVAAFFRSKGMSVTGERTKKFKGWSTEKKTYDTEVLKVSLERAKEEEIKDMTAVRLRQARLARRLQEKGGSRLDTLASGDVTPDDARKFVVSGLQEEREALGLNNHGEKKSWTQINILPKTNLDKLIEGLDYEGVLKLVADIKRERSRRGIPQTLASLPGEVAEE